MEWYNLSIVTNPTSMQHSERNNAEVIEAIKAEIAKLNAEQAQLMMAANITPDINERISDIILEIQSLQGNLEAEQNLLSQTTTTPPELEI